MTARLWQPFERSTAGRPMLTVRTDQRWQDVSWPQWRSAALRAATALRQLGVHADDAVACLLTNSVEACAGLLGVWACGARVISLPTPARGMEPAAYAQQLRRAIGKAGCTTLLCDGTYASGLAGLGLDVHVEAFSALDADRETEPDLPDEDAVIFVQFSSGSTSDPKGCELTARAIANQLEMLADALHLDPERDTGVVWLPMSHDMGLFGCVLLPYWVGYHVVLGTPERFLRRPASWLEDMVAFGGTVSATPSFGVSLAARTAGAIDLRRSRLDRCIVGGDQVSIDALQSLVSASDNAIPMRAMVPAYGLAEVVLAATMTPVGRGPTTAVLDRRSLAQHHVEPPEPARSSDALALCSAGSPNKGVTIAIDAQADQEIGEIVIDTPTLAAGYLADADLTAERFTKDGLRTGDLGFMQDGELYVTGRVDDLISVGGRNVYAGDIENALLDVPGVRRGRSAVVALRDPRGRQRLVALIEEPLNVPASTQRQAFARALSTVSTKRVGVALDECVFLASGQLPKTPSGKLQRFRCQQIALLDGLERVSLSNR